jgi:hypothetical protein
LTAAGTSISIVTQYDIARVQVIIVASCFAALLLLLAHVIYEMLRGCRPSKHTLV